MSEPPTPSKADTILVLAPRGRDALVAKSILCEARINAEICADVDTLFEQIKDGAGAALVTEEGLLGQDLRQISAWVANQPPWSDFPFIVLTGHGGGLERNPTAEQFTRLLGNVSFLERPFHATTLLSVAQSALRGRQRQYECRRLNEELEMRVEERTEELAVANRQLLSQIEERERVEATLRQMQRLEAVGQLTSGVAHDFNNLLTVVLGSVQFLEKEFEAAGIDGKIKQRLSHMRAAAERGAKLTDQLLSFSRRQRLEPKSIDLNEAVSKMYELLQTTIGGSIRIETSLAEGLFPASVDPTQLELAVLNLAINARDAMEVGGTLRVSTANVMLGLSFSPEDPPPGEYVAISVSDTGSGMSEEVRRKAFEPFFTTKEIGRGSGLGLSQVLGFAKQSGGGVRIDSRPGKGTTVHIFLPRASARPVPSSTMCSVAAAADVGHARILLVDDDNHVREITAGMIMEAGHDVVEAGSGGAALELLEHDSDVDLVLIDFAMPGMNGAELARGIRANRPSLPILFVTGFVDRSALSEVSEAEIIRKPFTSSELIDKIASALSRKTSRDLVDCGIGTT